jgi:hypothetical protein
MPQPQNKQEAQSWVDEFQKSFENRWHEHNILLEQLIWGTYDTQNNNNMTPISINDPQLADRITACMRIADEAFKTSGGSTKHYVRDVLLPILNREGLCFCTNTSPVEGHTESLYKDYPKTPAEVHPTTHTPLPDNQKFAAYPNQDVKGVLASQVAGKSGETEAATITDGKTQYHKYTDHGVQDLTKKLYRFGTAIEFLEIGKKMARTGWNGKNMFVYYVPPASYPPMTEVAKEAFGENLVPYNAYFAIKNVDGTVSTWTPSVNDCLAKDWYIVE